MNNPMANKNNRFDKFFKQLCFIMAIVILITSVALVVNVNKGYEKPDVNSYLNGNIVETIKNLELDQTSIIYVQNDDGAWVEYQRLHGVENRIWVGIDSIPENLKNAVISIEDERFYNHNGVDWKRTVGAFVNWLPFIDIYSSNQGGSTITQQLIKNITSDNDKSAVRKIREISRAITLEREVDKTHILEAYLNTISLGNGICGVQVAANYYFNKDVSQLSLVECAAIAGITKNPSAYNPITKPEGNKKRRESVLKKMFELEKISQEEYDEAVKTELVVDTSQKNSYEMEINNYFVDALIEEVVEDFSVKYSCDKTTATTMLYNGGYKIYSTLKPSVQQAMEEVYQDKDKYFSYKSKKNPEKTVESAMTIMDYQGHIVGIVGGTGTKDRNRGLNRALSSPRQPGSTMKPIGVYALAIENGIANYSTMIEDKPLPNFFGKGKDGPNEWYGYYAGPMTVKEALERSANTIPCWLLQSVTYQKSYDFLTQGLKFKYLSEVDKNPSSLALGGCNVGITTTESATAFAIFGNGGKFYNPTTYTTVVDSATNETILSTIEEGTQVISEETSTIMNKLLQNVVYGSQGTGGSIGRYSGMKAYAKTGTSSESNDLWMVAGTPYYVGSVWYGFDEYETIPSRSAAATVWRAVMSKVHKGLKYKSFTDSKNVIASEYCLKSGLLKGPGCTEVGTGYYASGKLPQVCNGTMHITEEPAENPAETPTDSTQSPSQGSDNGTAATQQQ